MTRQADFKRRVRARMAKTGEAYAAARARIVAGRNTATHAGRAGRPGLDGLPEAAEALAPAPQAGPATLPVWHVTNGDSAAMSLRAADRARLVLPWRDVLHEGPVPDVPDPELRRLRAALLGDDVAERRQILRWLEQRDQTLVANREGKYVLWFEADLYDQLQLIQILAKLAELHVPPERITLICIGEHLGIAHFGGLGQLQPAQLQGLLASAATPLSAAALDFATRAWAALRAPHPAGLSVIAATPSHELRFVAEAFDRLSREYPSTRDGLSLTERRILAATGAPGSTHDGRGEQGRPVEQVDQSGQDGLGGRGGLAVEDVASTAATVFRRIGAREARPFLGDSCCWRIMARLAAARVPLLSADPADAPIDASTRLRLTAAGARVLRGEADHVAQSGLDRWIGGVHLAGQNARWRWDEGTESIV